MQSVSESTIDFLVLMTWCHDLRGGPVFVEIFSICSDIFVVLLRARARILLWTTGKPAAERRRVLVIDLLECLKLVLLSIDKESTMNEFDAAGMLVDLITLWTSMLNVVSKSVRKVG
jgi:hypothetical protein